MAQKKRTNWKEKFKQKEVETSFLSNRIEQLENQLERNKKRTKTPIFKYLLPFAEFLLAIFVAWVIFGQKDIMNNQTKIMAHQDTLLQYQNTLVDTQNILINQQNDLVHSQNELFGIQNEKVEIQNRLVNSQNELVKLQNELFEKQNELFEIQNKRIVQQTYLQEAERRSSLSTLFNNVLDKIDEELKLEGNLPRKLSPQLIGRIISLSQALKPYRYLSNDEIIKRPVSPERGQLLLSLVNSQLDSSTYDAIFQKANFSYSDLKNTELSGSYLRYVNLSHAVLDSANLASADLTFSNLNEAKLFGTNLDYCKINQSKLVDTDFSFANIRWAEIKHSEIVRTNFSYCKLTLTNINSMMGLRIAYDIVRTMPVDSLESYFKKFRSQATTFKLFNKTDSTNIYTYLGKMYILEVIRNIESDGDLMSNFSIGRETMGSASFKKAHLHGTKFSNFIMSKVNFSGAYIESTEFENIVLKDTNFDEIIIDNKTWTKYFTPPPFPGHSWPLSMDYLIDEKKDFNPNIKKWYDSKGIKFYILKFIR